MDLSPTENLSHLQWMQEKNPYLAFRLLSILKKSELFPKENVTIEETTEVLFIENVINCFDAVGPFLDRGGKVVFIEKEAKRVAAFLECQEFLPHPNMWIILDEPSNYQIIAKQMTFKKQQFVGKLLQFRNYLDEVHLALSEYQDLGKTIFQNIQENLIHSEKFIHGKSLQGVYQKVPVIICGSGPSLEQNRELLKDFQKKGLIFAVGSAIPQLIKWGIQIDAGILIDPWPPIELYESLKEVSFPLFYQNRMSRHLFKMHRGPKIWMGSSGGWELEEWIYKEIGLEPFFFDAGWNAGCFALNVAHYLGCDVVLRIGMDGGEARDLDQGVRWMETFIANPAEVFNDNKLGNIDRVKLIEVIRRLNDQAMKNHIDIFLKRLERPINAEEFQQAKILLEVELIGEPLFEFFIKPLWAIFEPFHKKEKRFDVEDMIQMALFSKKVLEFQQHFQFYPTGGIQAKASFVNGLLDGEFCLYGKNGLLQRIGSYKLGKKEGKHIIYGEEGNERLIAEFHEDLPIHSYVRKNEKGVTVEELYYHSPDRFDRRCYTEHGELKSEGRFIEGGYLFRRYEKGGVVAQKKGKWQEGKLVWD